MRLLKEFNTRELIDALSYDFDPLQGLETSGTGFTTPGGGNWTRQARCARISTLEVAIRAQAKKFLAHPLCVQQLEAIWAGSIVFHSVADSLHRKPDTPRRNSYVAPDGVSPGRGPSRRTPLTKQSMPSLAPAVLMRRTVTLYDPYEASLFKLSRLRVPRYRNLFSTLSFGIMLGLFLAVLTEKSDDITGLEVLFWFWSAGYMLDEIVGFSEQGFGLYIMSVWNAFDLGILLMFMVYYVLRLYGILVPGVGGHHIASMAYNVLGSTAVLLFPRLFSALDHYRYFSQLLIAFKMMAMDLVAILVLIVISCSGFFVAFSLAFSNELGASNAAYAIFQLIMGFTPAAWDLWGEMNILGKFLLALFLFICHFLVVTILITVLTNSFMAVVKNADEEHQFLFAVNTISMVKSDALFSYIPPTNIIGWLLIPMKYMVSFKRFLRINRLIIKLTHLPILFTIFVYERLLLAYLSYGSTDLIENRGRPESNNAVPAFSVRGEMFSGRLREPSVTTFHKDRALEEVFRRPFRDTSTQAPSKYPSGRRNSSNVVSDWMRKMDDNDEYAPPQEDARSILDRLEGRSRPHMRRARTSGQPRRKYPFTSTQRAASDPDDVVSPFARPIAEEEEPDMNIEDEAQQTDADGDDELLTNDEDDRANSDAQPTPRKRTPSDKAIRRQQPGYETSEDDLFRTPMTVITRTPVRTPARESPPLVSSFQDQQDKQETSPDKKPSRQKVSHSRNLSSSTVLFSPTKEAMDLSRTASPERRPKASTRSGTTTPGRIDGLAVGGTRPPTRPRAIMQPREISKQGPSVTYLLSTEHRRRTPSFNAIALDLASDLGDNNLNPNFDNGNTLPASFTTQFEMAARMKAHEQRKNGDSDSDSNRMSRIMLARMTTLEEGFRDVLKEVKGLNRGDGSSQAASRGTHTPPEELAKKKGKGKKKSSKRDSGEDRTGSSL